MNDANWVQRIFEAMQVPGAPRVFVLGCFERRVTIYSQQVRALNLAEALLRADRIREGLLVAVVGAGIAGLTLAGGLARRGVRVKLLERDSGPIPLFRKAPSRWLHPRVYDWPLRGWNQDRAGLPVLDWKAGRVAEVVAALDTGWKQCLEQTASRIDPTYGAEDVRLDPQEGRMRLSWNTVRENGRRSPGSCEAEVVVLAVGFGLEESPLPGFKGYWEPDDFDVYAGFEKSKDKPRTWLVSGAGDGALTDLLRLCIRDFRHEKMVEDFVSDARIGEVAKTIERIEQDARARDPNQPQFLQGEYEKLRVDFVISKIEERLRDDTDVTLNVQNAYYFQPGSSALNRFLVSQLCHAGGFAFVPGRVKDAKKEGDRWKVEFDDGSFKEFDRVVFRHGPKPALDKDFPSIWKQCEFLRKTWAHAPHLLDQTRERFWLPGAFGPEDRPEPAPERPASAGFRLLLAPMAPDLDAHARALSDTIVRLGGIAAELTKLSTSPEPVRRALEAEIEKADGVVVLAGHQQGWVPPENTGGDGKQSATRMCWEIAVARGKDTLAFVVDPNAPWTGIKEQDLLAQVVEDEGETARVTERLKELQRFKKILEEKGAERFTSPQDLAEKARARIERWNAERTPAPESRRRTWKAQIEHPLQPAIHFQGRKTLLDALFDWERDPASPDRVIALVAVGGTGKTAVAERFLREVAARPRAGLFVWSFYDNPQTEAFLREACVYFAGEAGEGTGGYLERLKAALRDGEPHLLVLDGMETVQAEGKADRARGELQDQALKLLLRSIAAGLGRTKLLVTSRFPLADLDPWEKAGYREEKLDDLDVEAARGLLREWGVHGDDAALDALTGRVGRHALSVTVLGSYLAHYAAGDPGQVKHFDWEVAGAADPRAAKLQRLLTHYATAMAPPERELMSRLSMFPRGIAVDTLAVLVDAGGKIAGVLAGQNEARLTALLETLVRKGLAFGYGEGNRRIYTAHPFLREHFRLLAGVSAEELHEVIRSRLAPALEERPATSPSDPETLDRYEALIEHTRLAGRVEEAFDLYWFGIGSYKNLGWRLGDYVRGARILAGFVPDGDPERVAPELPDPERSKLVNGCGLFASDLGDLHLARRYFRAGLEIKRRLNDPQKMSLGLRHGADLAIMLGQLREARANAEQALHWAKKANAKNDNINSHSSLAYAVGLGGDVRAARSHFAEATQLEGKRLYSRSGISEAELRWRTGTVVEAKEQSLANMKTCEYEGWLDDISRLHTLLGQLALDENLEESRRHLNQAREWVTKTGDVEVLLQAARLASDLALRTGDANAALAEATEGLHQAEACGYGLYAIDLHLALARAHLALRDFQVALRHARTALDQSTHAECGYAWGEADGAHLAGLAHEGLGERELALRRFRQAAEVRARIEHPGAEQSRQAAARLAGGRTPPR